MKATVEVAGVTLTGALSDVAAFLIRTSANKLIKAKGRFKRRKRKVRKAVAAVTRGRPKKKRKYTKRSAFWGKKDAA